MKLSNDCRNKFWITSIKIKNFRCFEKYTAEFCENINIIKGNNAVGKTSLVESVNLMGCCKSHRTSSDNSIIKKGYDFYNIECSINDAEESVDVMMVSSKKGKKVSVNNKFCRNLSDYVGYFKTVMFCPEDLNLVKGDPEEKRKFLDVNLSQLDKEYLRSLIKYKKILKQRNEYLKQVENKDYDEVLLNTYTSALIEEAKTIIQKRNEFIVNINKYYNEKIFVISNGKETAKIVYNPNVTVDNLLITFERKQKLDLLTCTTNTGPHRDSFDIHINDENSSGFASQGQQRTLALALKLALAELIKEKTNKVVIILDDVFGELDEERQNQLLKLINYDCQIFITTTSVDNLTEEVLKNSKVIEIKKDGDSYE